MRKIKTQTDIEKSKKRNALFLGIVMIFLMVVSVAGYALLSGGNLGGANREYPGEGYNGNYFVYMKDGVSYYFSNSKEEVSDIPVDISLSLNDYLGQKIYLSSEENAWNEVLVNLGNVISEVQEACYGNCDKDLPEKNCDGTDRLIIWEESSSENRVYQEGQCVFIQGGLNSVDAFLYKLIGI